MIECTADYEAIERRVLAMQCIGQRILAERCVRAQEDYLLGLGESPTGRLTPPEPELQNLPPEPSTCDDNGEWASKPEEQE